MKRAYKLSLKFLSYILFMIGSYPISAHTTESTSSICVSNWKYRLPIHVMEEGSSGIVEYSLPPSVLAKAKMHLGDLRLIDPANKAIPYVIRIQKGQETYSEPYDANRYLNRTFMPGKHSSIIADFGKNQVRNLLDVMTAGDNFRRRAMIEGGDDGLNWEVLTNNGWLFAIPGEHSSHRINRLTVLENNFRYYRITVYNDMHDPEKIEIRNVQASHIVKTSPDLVAVPVINTEVQQNTLHKYTEIQFDLGFENLYLHDIALRFHDDNFMRRCSVHGRNQKIKTILRCVENSLPRKTEVEEPWTDIIETTIYRVTTDKGSSESLQLSCEGIFRYIAIRIYNRDDKPLSLTDASARRLNQRFFFQHHGKQNLYLLFGNTDASAPSYDFGSFVDRLRNDGVFHATVDAPEDNPSYKIQIKTVPWTERNGWLLTLAVIFLIGILGYLLWKQCKQIQTKH